MLAALLLNIAALGASSHDGWVRQHFRKKRDRNLLAVQLKRLYEKATPTEQVQLALKPFTKGEQIRWLSLANDDAAIARFLDALQAQRDLLAQQQRIYADLEAIRILEMSENFDRELVSRSLLAIKEVLH